MRIIEDETLPDIVSLPFSIGVRSSIG